MPNIRQEITRHNGRIQSEEDVQIPAGCNCRNKEDPCPMEGKCLTDHLVYGTTVVEDNFTQNTYTGLTRNTLKKRWYKHRSDFRNREDEHATTLSTHIWKLKDRGENYDISWEIIDRATEFNPTNRKCRLCLKEKYHILFNPSGASLNHRSELYSTCRHRLRLLLANT